MHRFVVGRAGDRQITPELARQMFELRHSVFHERLRWDVRSHCGQEHDEYDDLSTVYVIARNLLNGQIDGCWRLRPTTSSYMLRDTFPQLLHGNPAPSDEAIWEVSRFAVINAGDNCSSYGFGELAQDLVARTVEFGLANNIKAFVWVCSAAVERLSLKLGYRPQRLGAPLRIGKVMSVASKILVDDHTSAIAFERLYPQAMRIAA